MGCRFRRGHCANQGEQVTALTIVNIIVIAVFLPLNIVVLVNEVKARRVRRQFSKVFWETYQIGQDDE